MKIFYRICLTIGIILMLGTVGLGVYARQNGILFIKTGGNPKDTVRCFYDAVLAQDYQTAYGYLLNYETLGFEAGDTDLAKELPAVCREEFRRALLSSYGYELVGEPVVQQLNAQQKIRFTCFDPEHFCQDMNDRFHQMLNDSVQSRPKREIFDDAGDYRVEILEKLYEDALRETMQNGSLYLRTTEYTVELRYQDREWKILVNDEMTEGFVGRQR